MSRNKYQWIAECERVQNDFGEGQIDKDEFRVRMELLGFDDDEINAEIEAYESV